MDGGPKLQNIEPCGGNIVHAAVLVRSKISTIAIPRRRCTSSGFGKILLAVRTAVGPRVGPQVLKKQAYDRAQAALVQVNTAEFIPDSARKARGDAGPFCLHL